MSLGRDLYRVLYQRSGNLFVLVDRAGHDGPGRRHGHHAGADAGDLPGPGAGAASGSQVDAATVDGLLARAAKLGLLTGPLDFGHPPVADAPNTTVTIVADGRAHRHAAAALGISDEATGGRTGGRSRPSSRPLRSYRPAIEPGSRAPSACGSSAHTSPTRNCRSPLWRDLSTERRSSRARAPPCLVIEGDDLRLLRAALVRANARTPWLINGVARSVAFVPVVPGSQPCPP